MMNFIQSCLLILLPTLEFLLLRFFVKFGLGIKIGWVFVTDFDFIVPLPLAYCLLHYLLGERRALKLVFQRASLRFNLIGLGVFIVLSYWYPTLPTPLRTLWLLVAFITLASAFFIFIPPSFYLTHRKRSLIPACALVGLSAALAQNIPTPFWAWLGPHVTSCLVSLFPNVNIYFANCGPAIGLHIGHPQFAMNVGRGCSGADGLIFMLGCYSCFLILNHSHLNRWEPLKILMVGIVISITLSVARLVTVFALGRFLSQHFHSTDWRRIFEIVVHANAGWALYVLGIGSYFLWLHERLRKTRPGLEEERHLGVHSG